MFPVTNFRIECYGNNYYLVACWPNGYEERVFLCEVSPYVSFGGIFLGNEGVRVSLPPRERIIRDMYGRPIMNESQANGLFVRYDEFPSLRHRNNCPPNNWHQNNWY
ncbi:hypothetical protein Hokovirus_2_106 [Hokovirus HKV1]|uniref:Uncharacterized protein n=1 Tax=Hokovirus HKV1 TaxID=1977638 RepID=A0A1V0SFS9_9VIRU|nr:hypothetical protein Hokovirus_2_106 [Hokovirus HKV1]